MNNARVALAFALLFGGVAVIVFVLSAWTSTLENSSMAADFFMHAGDAFMSLCILLLCFSMFTQRMWIEHSNVQPWRLTDD